MEKQLLHELFTEMREQNTEQHRQIIHRIETLSNDMKGLQVSTAALKAKVATIGAIAATIVSGAVAVAQAYFGG